MIIVKTDNVERHGVTVTLPGVGLQTPDHNGEFVAPHLEGAENLCMHHPDFYIKGAEEAEEVLEEIKEKSEVNELTEELLETADEVANPLSAEERDIFLTTLPGKTNNELKEDCKLFGLPAKEWRNLNKAELIAYITSKI